MTSAKTYWMNEQEILPRVRGEGENVGEGSGFNLQEGVGHFAAN